MRETIIEASGGRYRFNVGTSPHLNYFSNGGSDDWVRGKPKTVSLEFDMQQVPYFQWGSRQNDTGWALCSNDDVIMLMTSLLLLCPDDNVGGPW